MLSTVQITLAYVLVLLYVSPNAASTAENRWITQESMALGVAAAQSRHPRHVTVNDVIK